MKNTSTGNRVLFKIKGQTIGACQSVNISDDFGLQDIDEIGNPESVEMVVGKLTHTISGEKYFVSADILSAIGFVPKADEWLTAPEFEVEVIDKIDGRTIELYTGCKFATHSRKYGKHTVSSEDFTIRAIHKST